jgi:hypothetical protein
MTVRFFFKIKNSSCFENQSQANWKAQGPNKYVNENKIWWTWKKGKVTNSPSKAMEW